MDNSIYIAISRQKALQQQMNLVANNIANMNTSGYRSQHALFKEYVADQDRIAEVNDPISLVQNIGQYDNTKQGDIRTTGNTLDVALNGPGFFGAVTASGIEYTRAGNFTINGLGQLVTSTGFPVANQGGAPITIPDDAQGIIIGKDGTISSEDGTIDQIMISEFENYQNLTPQGNGLYKTEDQALPATETVAMQGAVESSNVNPILEMTRMIEISRGYQSTQRLMQGEHDKQLDSIKKLSRVT
ncbi:MAG: flagellar basal-body rod protein FlgF [Pseudomonadota bacterium]|jgi:flagellar basal-body rod protein FlgF|nr:flagellar basal-body rod protein FlgF [Pseudomonadota bacterium]MEC9236248.1 flagellar basal-body rod protein FlgF [Pseudomonadota bacterium]MED5422179.1 flagellar basal-body rod protein FlgF [Pseudomonadota bacterium]